MWARALFVLPSFVLGAAIAICAVALHDYWWGLVLAVMTTLATMVAVPGGWWSRLPFAFGWVTVLLLATTERAEGDYLISTDIDGYLLLGLGMLVFGGGFVGLVSRRGSARDSGVARPSP